MRSNISWEKFAQGTLFLHRYWLVIFLSVFFYKRKYTYREFTSRLTCFSSKYFRNAVLITSEQLKGNFFVSVKKGWMDVRHR